MMLLRADALEITPTRRPPAILRSCPYADLSLRLSPTAPPAVPLASSRHALEAQIELLRLVVSLGTFDALLQHILGALGRFPGNRTDTLLGRIGAAIDMLSYSLQGAASLLQPIPVAQPSAPAAYSGGQPEAKDPELPATAPVPSSSNPPSSPLRAALAAQEAAEHALHLCRELSPLLPTPVSPITRRLATDLGLVLQNAARRQRQRRLVGSRLRESSRPAPVNTHA
jgi:hypothetical protein